MWRIFKMSRYVKRDFIHAIKSNYVILLGQRSNGKSFAIKEDIIKNYMEKGEEFAYIRRYKEDCRQYMIEEYFSDIIRDRKGEEHLKKWTKGKYNYISTWQQSIYLSNIDDSGKVTRGERLGRMFAVSWATHYKSLSFPNITSAVYEEFVTDEAYLDGEVKRFMNLISTIFRESAAKVYLVGNTVSRINPFFSEWQLTRIPKQKINSVDVYNYHYHDENGEKQTASISVYLTHSTNINSGMFFGNAAKAITSSVWDTNEQPHLMGDRCDYECIYTMVFIYDRTMFLMEFLKSPEGNYTWFVTPKTTPPKKNSRIISNKFILDNMATVGFNPITEQERVIFNYLKGDKICYSDNLTGTEFMQCYNMLR